MAAETFHRRVSLWLRREHDRNARLIDLADSDVKFVVPVSAHLRAGQKAVQIPITHSMEASPKGCWALLATTRPGVVARLARRNTTASCRGTGLLMSTTDDVFSQVQSGATTPAYASGQWLNHEATTDALYNNQHAAATADDQWSHDIMATTTDAGATTSQLRYIWGRPDVQNLGNVDDGKIFQFWCKASAALTIGELEFMCYPFAADTHEGTLATTDGDENDLALVANAQGDRYSANFTTQLVAGRWALVTLRKEDFTATGPAVWDRVTAMNIKCTHSPAGAYTNSFANFMFGDPLESQLDAVQWLSYLPTLNEPITLSLDAPASSDALVRGIVMAR